MARDLLAIPRKMARLHYPQHMLGSRRFMLQIERIGSGAVIEQVLGNLDRRGVVQGRLAIGATEAHFVRIRGQEFAQLVEHPQARRRTRIHHSAALRQKWRKGDSALI